MYSRLWGQEVDRIIGNLYQTLPRYFPEKTISNVLLKRLRKIISDQEKTELEERGAICGENTTFLNLASNDVLVLLFVCLGK
jgi:hypothetical protein